jgi:hypothetical protein
MTEHEQTFEQNSNGDVQVLDRRIFAKALEILGPDGEYWIKGEACKFVPSTKLWSSDQQHECYCMEGAICKALGLDPDAMYNLVPPYLIYFKAMAEYLLTNRQVGSPANWQDLRTTTFEQVRKMLLDLAFSAGESLSGRLTQRRPPLQNVKPDGN